MTKETGDPFAGALKASEHRTIAALTLDIAYYQALLDEEDMEPDQKRELIEALWSIVVAFVDLGFGAHPVQQVQSTDADDGTGSGHNLQDAVREFIAVQRREDNQQEESEHA